MNEAGLRVLVSLGALAFAALLAGLGALTAAQKGRPPWEGAILGLFFGPLGVLIEVILPAVQAHPGYYERRWEYGTLHDEIDGDWGGQAMKWKMNPDPPPDFAEGDRVQIESDDGRYTVWVVVASLGTPIVGLDPAWFATGAGPLPSIPQNAPAEFRFERRNVFQIAGD